MISNPAAESQWNRPMATRRESSLKKNEKRVLLGSNYMPGRNAVICGRGKACTSSPGNKKLRSYVDSFAKSYGSASNKEQKSKIVSTIISLIEEPEGGAFVKFEESTWWKVDEAYAREKIGNLFRDVLHTKYRSSSKAKQARKHKAAAVVSGGFNEEIESIATKLSMDQSYSSTSSAGSTVCNLNLGTGCESSNNGLRPSSIGFPLGGAMPFMHYGMRDAYNFPQETMFHPNARRSMLLNYCQEALHIASSDATRMSRAALYNNAPDMARFNNMMMQSAASRCTALAAVTPDKSSSSLIRETKTTTTTTTSSQVSEDGDANNHDDDEASIATLSGDDDIFSDFLDGKVDDLSGIF